MEIKIDNGTVINVDFEMCYEFKGKYYKELTEMYEDFWKDLSKKDKNGLIKFSDKMPDIEDGFFIVAKISGTAIGFTRFDIYRPNWCCVKNAEIIDLYVRPEYRNMGIGRAIIAEVERFASNNYDCHKIRIAYIAGNKDAGRLYESLGYKTNYTELIKDI